MKPQSGTIEDMLQDFHDFKLRVPTYGGLLLNEDLSKVLLVQVGCCMNDQGLGKERQKKGGYEFPFLFQQW